MERISAKEFESYVVKFFNKKKEFEKYKKEFDKEKEEFYKESEKYFEDNEIEKNVDFDLGKINFTLSRIKRVKLVFDIDKQEIQFYNIDKLCKKFSKKIVKEVIRKRIIINEVDSFMKYMKEIGASPKVLKSFFEVQKEVDKEKLDQLEAVGLIDASDIEDCYEVEVSKPAFSIRSKSIKH